MMQIWKERSYRVAVCEKMHKTGGSHLFGGNGLGHPVTPRRVAGSIGADQPLGPCAPAASQPA